MKLANVVKHPQRRHPARDLVGAATKRVDYAPDLFTDEALSFIQRQPEDRPFFVYLPYDYPQQKRHDHLYWKFYELGSAQAVRASDVLACGAERNVSCPSGASIGDV